MKNLLFNRKGQSMVEMALILPILLLLLLGIMEAGRILGGYLELQSACRDVTRYVAVHNITTSDSISVESDGIHITTTNSDGTTSDNLVEQFVLLEPDKVTKAFSRSESSDHKDKWVTVTLNYSMDLLTPFFGAIVGDPFDMMSRMVMRSE